MVAGLGCSLPEEGFLRPFGLSAGAQDGLFLGLGGMILLTLSRINNFPTERAIWALSSVEIDP